MRNIASQGSKVNNSEEYREILKRWFDFFNRPLGRAVNEFRRIGYTEEKIGDVIGVSKQLVNEKFPRV